jgi:hypothetical protein
VNPPATREQRNRGEKKVMNSSMSTEGNNDWDSTTRDDGFLNESLRTIDGELMPLMVSARKYGDRRTALMAANMIRSRIEILVKGGFIDPSVGLRLLKDVESMERGYGRDRSLLERAIGMSVRLAITQARQARAHVAHKNDREASEA